MIYLIYGSNQDILINKEIKKILKELNVDSSDFSVSQYSLDEVSLDEALFDASTSPLLSDKKTIIVKNAYVFLPVTSSNRNRIPYDKEKFSAFLKNPPEWCNLIFAVKENIDEKNEFFIRIKDIGKTIKSVTIEKDEWNGVIGQLINQYQVQMDDDALREFSNRTQGDLNTVISELKKLKELNEYITKDIVVSFVSRPLEDNMFGMCDAILTKNYESAFKIFYDLKKKQEDVFKIIASLSTQLKFVYQTALLHHEGYSNDEIVKKFNSNVKSGRVYYTLKVVHYGIEEEILDLLDKLADLSYQLATYKINNYDGFELFLTSLGSEN